MSDEVVRRLTPVRAANYPKEGRPRWCKLTLMNPKVQYVNFL